MVGKAGYRVGMRRQHWGHYGCWKTKALLQSMKTLYSEWIWRDQIHVCILEPSTAITCFRRDQEYLTNLMERCRRQLDVCWAHQRHSNWDEGILEHVGLQSRPCTHTKWVRRAIEAEEENVRNSKHIYFLSHPFSLLILVHVLWWAPHTSIVSPVCNL